MNAPAEPGHVAEVWISPEILGWQVGGEGSSAALSGLGPQAWEEWEHAELRLHPDEPAAPDLVQDRKDAMAALSRAVERRIQLFRSVYAIDRLPGMRARDALEQLGTAGLARGLVLSQIRRLRNKTEHESAAPPARDECLIYLDAVWYFLRSTERFAHRMTTELDLLDSVGGRELTITITVSLPAWSVHLQGHLPATVLSRSARERFIKVSVAHCDQLGALLLERSDGSVFLAGFVDEPGPVLAVARKYFAHT